MSNSLRNNNISVNYPRALGTRETTRALCARSFAHIVYGQGAYVYVIQNPVQVGANSATGAYADLLRTHVTGRKGNPFNLVLLPFKN